MFHVLRRPEVNFLDVNSAILVQVGNLLFGCPILSACLLGRSIGNFLLSLQTFRTKILTSGRRGRCALEIRLPRYVFINKRVVRITRPPPFPFVRSLHIHNGRRSRLAGTILENCNLITPAPPTSLDSLSSVGVAQRGIFSNKNANVPIKAPQQNPIGAAAAPARRPCISTSSAPPSSLMDQFEH